MATKEAVKSNGSGPVEEDSAIHIERLNRPTMYVPIRGVSPLIVHRWSQKAMDMLPGGKNSAKKGRKKAEYPTAEEAYQATRYRLPDGTDGFPSVGFQAAMCGSYHLFDGLKLKHLKTMLLVEGVGPGQLVPIEGTPQMREDVVRIGMGTSNLRHRAMYPEWSAVLPVTYLASHLSQETVLGLVDAAGMSGVGEWRPSAPRSATGTYGRFVIDEDQDITSA